MLACGCCDVPVPQTVGLAVAADCKSPQASMHGLSSSNLCWHGITTLMFDGSLDAALCPALKRGPRVLLVGSLSTLLGNCTACVTYFA